MSVFSGKWAAVRVNLMKSGSRILTCLGLLCVASMVLGCEVRLKPILHTVEYQSDVACAPSPKDCPWARLEEQAQFSALVNCLLAGASVLETEPSDRSVRHEKHFLAPTPPRYGYEHVADPGEGKRCQPDASACRVASRFDRELTWAGCGTQPLKNGVLRGGEGMTGADKLTDSVVVTGSLAESTDGFKPPQGMDGPDHFYTFTLTEKTRVETAVGANSSDWSRTRGHQAPWQPALFLLAADGKKLGKGQVWRAGVTYLFPVELRAGTYYLVVDSSQREFTRGDRVYRLYLGLNRNHLGPTNSQ